jgi:hypothetical protein
VAYEFHPGHALLPDWFVARLGKPDPATLERRVLQALVADCLRTGHASNDEARRWLGLAAPGTLEAFCKAHGIVGGDAVAGDGG